MFKKISPILILFLALPFMSLSQEPAGTDTVEICLSDDEMRLYRLINDLRQSSGKSEIPVSYSLSKLAKLHTKDLETNHPDTSDCNYHSWSDKGEWIPCCYNPHDANTKCIRNKPGELTTYNHPGYELITWDSRKAHPDSVFNFWNSFKVSQNMFLNDGEWKRLNWKAIGLSISEQYVSIWFGDKPDSEKEPSLCGTGENKLTADSNTKEAVTLGSPYLSASGEYHIIHGSYSVAADAETVKQELSTQFPDIGIIKGENNYRISLDRFSDMQEARKAKENFSSKFQDSWLLKY